MSASASSSRDLLEVTVGYLLIIATIWTPNPYQRVLFWISFAVIVGICLLGRMRGEPLGFGLSGFARSLWAIALAAAAAALAIEIAIRMGTMHYFFGHTVFGPHAWGYLVWAILQQLILQTFLLARLMRLFPERNTAVIIAALMFSLAHIPNPVLVFATMLWGIGACWLFLRYRNLYTVGIIHFIFGVSLAVTVPANIQHNMRVGLGYYFYRAPHAHVNVPAGAPVPAKIIPAQR